tara:strand:+ start:509 stop:670 length:162 start_codon:yes stop_codon:yes gene_type:complete
MEETIKKFKFKGNAIVLNAPENLKTEFIILGCKTQLDEKTKNANTLAFIHNNK